MESHPHISSLHRFAYIDKRLWKWSSEAVLQHRLSIKRFSTVNISKEFKIVPNMEFAFKSMSKRLLRNLLNNFSTNETNYFCDICRLQAVNIGFYVFFFTWQPNFCSHVYFEGEMREINVIIRVRYLIWWCTSAWWFWNNDWTRHTNEKVLLKNYYRYFIEPTSFKGGRGSNLLKENLKKVPLGGFG